MNFSKVQKKREGGGDLLPSGTVGALAPAYLTSAIFLVLWNFTAPVDGSVTSSR